MFKATAYSLGYGSRWKGCPWQDSHPHWTASEAVVSALDYMGLENGSLGWIRTTNPPLPGRMLSLLSYKAE